MKILLWFYLSCKRLLKRSGYLLLLLLVPLCLWGTKKLEKSGDEGIRVALYTEEEGLGTRIIERLEKEDGAFSFYQCSTSEELEADVAAKRAECGYVFYQGLEEKLDNEDYRRCIGLYTSPSTAAAPVVSETLFAALMKEYEGNILKAYVMSKEELGGLSKDMVWERINGLFELYQTNNSTYDFVYETAEGGSISHISPKMGFPVRGVAAVLVFICGIFSAVTVLEDEKKGLYIPLDFGKRGLCQGAAAMAPVFLAAVSALVSLAVTGTMENPLYELFCMAVYCGGVWVFALLLKALIPNPRALTGLIPFFIIGSLLLCPVFLDVGAWIPQMRIFQRLFLPYYYLIMF